MWINFRVFYSFIYYVPKDNLYGEFRKNLDFFIAGAVNQPVSDRMFALDIPEGAKVIDKRLGGKETTYTAMDKGELSLAKGGLDLDKMKWLMQEGDLTYGKEEPSVPAQWFRNITLSLGLFLIFLALYMKYRQWRGQKT